MDAATAGVLRDVAIVVWLALAIGATAYHVVRAWRPALAWNTGGRVPAGHFIVTDAGVAAGILVLLLSGLAAAGPSASAEIPELSPVILLGDIVLKLVFCVALLFYLRQMRGLSPAEIFGLRQQSLLKALGLAFLLIVPALLLVNNFAAGIVEWMKTFWPTDSAQDTVEAFRKTRSVGTKGLLVIVAVIIAPLSEELLFRGLIYGVIKRFTDSYFAALCSALLFGVIHFHVGSLFPLALLAITFCAAYEITGNLLVPMVMHALFNATTMAVLVFSKGAP